MDVVILDSKEYSPHIFLSTLREGVFSKKYLGLFISTEMPVRTSLRQNTVYDFSDVIKHIKIQEIATDRESSVMYIGYILVGLHISLHYIKFIQF